MTRRPVGRSIGRDVALALMFKLAALSLIYLMFFRAEARPTIDAAGVARHLLASDPLPVESAR